MRTGAGAVLGAAGGNKAANHHAAQKPLASTLGLCSCALWAEVLCVWGGVVVHSVVVEGPSLTSGCDFM